MNSHLLEEVIYDQKELFAGKRELVRREIDYKRYVRHEQIVVISGVRRCGKSTLLRQFAGWHDDYHFINFDDERLINFTVEDFAELMLLFKKRSAARVILMDEVQNIENWERFVRRVHDEGYKLYITGSNSKLLSSELGTHLTGRYVKIELYPFSFREMLHYHNIKPEPLSSAGKAEIMKYFDKYLENGGFPEMLKYDDREFLSRTYEDVIYRDIIARYGIKETKQFLQVAHYLFSNVTGDLSYHAIKTTLGMKSSVSVKKYIGYLEDSYLAFELYKHDYSLKKQHINNKKIYVIDNGMRNEVAFRFSSDHGKLLENLILVEMKRQQQTVYMHKGKRECDFILEDRNCISGAIQVCYDLDDRNRKREISGLLEAAACYNLKNGLILTYNTAGEEVVDGVTIAVMPVWKWLINDCPV